MHKFLNFSYLLTILLDIICGSFFIYNWSYFNHLPILFFYFIIWFTTSIIYYFSKYTGSDYSNITFSDMLFISLYMIKFLILSPLFIFINNSAKYFRNFYLILSYALHVVRAPSRIITKYLFSNYRYFSYNLLVVVYIIKYIFVANLFFKFVDIVKSSENEILNTAIVDILSWILYGVIILIFILLSVDLSKISGEHISIKLVLVIIVMIFIFGLLGLKDGKIKWVFIALIFTSTKDILSTDIKVLYSYEKIDELTENEFKKRIIDLKYTLLLIIPVVYFALMLSELIVDTEAYKYTMCRIMDNKSNKLLEFIFEGNIKFFLTFIFTFFVYNYRVKIYKIIIEKIILRK